MSSSFSLPILLLKFYAWKFFFLKTIVRNARSTAHSNCFSNFLSFDVVSFSLFQSSQAFHAMNITIKSTYSEMLFFDFFLSPSSFFFLVFFIIFFLLFLLVFSLVFFSISFFFFIFRMRGTLMFLATFLFGFLAKRRNV